jgi:hypothetical protein
MSINSFLYIHEEVRAILNLIEDHRWWMDCQKAAWIGKRSGPDIRKLK